jgi:hypothetical protein
MKFSTVFLAIAAVATVSAARVDTNAYRMARGLPPNPPAKRSTAALGMRAKPFLMDPLTKSLGAKRGTPSGVPPPKCKPALELCSANSQCCADFCLLGVSVPLSEFMNVSVLRCSDYSFAFNWRTEIVRLCVPYRELHYSCCSHSPLLSPGQRAKNVGRTMFTRDILFLLA